VWSGPTRLLGGTTVAGIATIWLSLLSRGGIIVDVGAVIDHTELSLSKQSTMHIAQRCQALQGQSIQTGQEAPELLTYLLTSGLHRGCQRHHMAKKWQ